MQNISCYSTELDVVMGQVAYGSALYSASGFSAPFQLRILTIFRFFSYSLKLCFEVKVRFTLSVFLFEKWFPVFFCPQVFSTVFLNF